MTRTYWMKRALQVHVAAAYVHVRRVQSEAINIDAALVAGRTKCCSQSQGDSSCSSSPRTRGQMVVCATKVVRSTLQTLVVVSARVFAPLATLARSSATPSWSTRADADPAKCVVRA